MPDSTNLLCTFHILQAVWQWLWDLANGINYDDRVLLMNSFKAILNSENLIVMENAYNRCLENFVARKYEKWLRYVQDCCKFKEKWVLAYRNESLHGHHTNNFSETSIKIFKDIVLSRVKAYNVIALIDFCVTSLEEYYVGKLRAFANFHNRESSFFRKNLSTVSYLEKEDIIQVDLSQPLFFVPSENNRDINYTVDTEVESCTCKAGKFGKFCKHQCAVYQFFQIRPVNFPLISAEDRYEMAKIAVEADVAHPSFYEEFHSLHHDKVFSQCTPPSSLQTPALLQDISGNSYSLPPPIGLTTVHAPFQYNNTLNLHDRPESLLEEKNELIESIKN